MPPQLEKNHEKCKKYEERVKYLEERVEYLKWQVEIHQAANARKDEIIARFSTCMTTFLNSIKEEQMPDCQ